LEILEQRLPPGDAVWGALLGWGAIAAADAAPPTVDAVTGVSPQARLPGDLDDPIPFPGLTRARRYTEAGSGAVPASAPSARAEQGLSDAGSASTAPASRLVGEAPGNAPFSAGSVVTAPPGSGNPAPAFAAAAGTASGHVGSALAAPAPRPPTSAPTLDRAPEPNNRSGPGPSFEANAGQTDPRVDFIARAGGATVFLTPTAAVFALQKSHLAGQQSLPGMPSPTPEAPGSTSGAAVYMDLVGADPAARPVGQEPLAGKVNYFIGNDPARWHADIPTFGRVEYPNIYPGISLAYHGGPGGLEYDFVLSPGADAHAIALKFEGADGVAINAQGDLVVHAAAGDLVQHAPVVYQEAGGRRQPVSGRFALDSGHVRFEVGAYDKSRPLVIDPLVLGYSTYLGGGGIDYDTALAVDGAGSAYVTGYTSSADFPTTPGAFDSTYNGGLNDIFAAKLNADGRTLLYATYLGGSDDDRGYAIAVDAEGSAYVGGIARSSDYPTTPGAFHTTSDYVPNGVVTKLNATGSALSYSTYVSGSGSGDVYGIAVDAVGRAYVTGSTRSKDFPVTPGAFQTTCNSCTTGDAYVLKLNPTGSALAYGTFLGGYGFDEAFAITVDGAGDAFVTGRTAAPASGQDDFPTTPGAFDTSYNGGNDGFVAEFSADGSALVYSSFLGGSGGDQGNAIAVDGAGSAYVTGDTGSADFPTTPGAFDTTSNGGEEAFGVKVMSGGGALAYATFLGGSSSDTGRAVAVDGAGHAYVGGDTHSADFPTTPGAFQGTYHGAGDGFLTRLSPDGSALAYSTFLGGASGDAAFSVAADGTGNVYVAGGTYSADFPTTPGAFSTTLNGGGDGFVTKFCTHACRVPAEGHHANP
jgi:hypothetical protein